MGLKGFLVKRAIFAVITIFAVISVNFIIFRIAPGDPVRLLFRHPGARQEKMDEIRAEFGLDKPLWVQFVIYVQQLFRGNVGYSFFRKRPVLEVIAARIPQTVLLVGTAAIIATFLGVALGAFAGWRRGSKTDLSILSFSLVTYSIPTFCMGLILLLLFAFIFPIFPLGGMTTPASGLTGFEYWKDVFWHMFLPLISMVFWYLGEYVLITRSSMLDVLTQDYITTARAKGLKEFAILKGHALRNALLPVVTIAGLELGFVVAGAIEVETVFSWPGVGRLLYDSVMKRDYPVLQGIFLIMTITVILANLVVDLIYGVLDPRVKVGE
jgi:peptide/nickel transport system permease protein